ncbi:MAG: hypothetical protein GF381_01250 [Candidatus Pacebacteria bacterium]|nr:hypothetical protein [Candidatus Paceibacterota bacterium]
MKKTTQDTNWKLFITNRRKFLLAVLMIWGGLALIYFGFRPQIKNILEINKKLSAARVQLSTLRQKSSDLKQIEVSEQFENIEKVDEVLPSHKPVLELMTNLHQASFATQVAMDEFSFRPGEIASASAQPIANFQSELNTQSKPTTSKSRSKSQTDPNPTNPNKRYSGFEFKLSVAGSKKNVTEFLTLVEQIVPLTTITDLNLSHTTNPNATNRGQAQIEESKSDSWTETKATMTLTTYYYTQSITTTLTSQLPSIGDQEVEAFEKIQQFRPSGFRPQSEIINSGELEDFFEVDSLEQFR